MPARGFPYLGHGVGLRVAHYERALRGALGVDWVEVVTENFFGDGGRPRAVLESIRREVPLVFHGVSLGIGSYGCAASGVGGAHPVPGGFIEEPDAAYLRQVKALADAFEPAWVSDHVCWTRFGDRYSHDLLPLPYTEEALRVAVRATQRVQEALGRPIVLENVSSYVAFRASEMPEWEFLAELARRSGCSLLLDLNNVVVNAHNHGFSVTDYLAGLTREQVTQFHLANHSRRDRYRLDDHRGPVPPEVWSLYEAALRRFGAVSTLIEWDEEVPTWERLVDESREAARRERRVLGEVERADIERVDVERADIEAERAHDIERGVGAAAEPSPEPAAAVLGLAALQGLFFDALMWPRGVRDLALVRPQARAAIEASFIDRGGLSAVERLDVYADAYFYRLLDATREMFPRLAFLAGTTAFHDLITDYVLDFPSTSPNLHHLGERLPAFIAAHPLGHGQPMLVEMATLELALARALHGPDSPVLTREALAQLPPERWPSARWCLVPVAQRLAAFYDLEHVADLCAQGDRERALESPRRAEASTVLVNRRQHSVYFRALQTFEARAFEALAAGCTFEALCDLVGADDLTAPEVLTLLQRWLDEALLTDTPSAPP